jgi:hypothetical protein
MPTPSAAKLLTTILAGSLLAAGVAIGACSGSDGITPSCDYNIDDAGNILPDQDGCVQLASCPANPADPTACCADAGTTITDCCYGFGSQSVVDDAGNPIFDDAGLGTCSPEGGGNPQGN